MIGNSFSSWNWVFQTVTWKLSAGAGAEGEGDVYSMRPLPLGSHSPSGDQAEWKQVERCAGEGGQPLEAAWGCECGALRQSFPTDEPNYDPPRGGHAMSGVTVAPAFYPNVPFQCCHFPCESKRKKLGKGTEYQRAALYRHFLQGFSVNFHNLLCY